MTTISVVIPWPHNDLSPNARVSRFVLARRKRVYRTDCGWLALQAFSAAGKPKFSCVAADIVFNPPNAIRRDTDNALASIKSGIDGVAGAIRVDDSKWSITIAMGPPVKHGSVQIRITGVCDGV